ncbi:MAG: hypothetical protein ACKO96_23230, partial [Flammeovirgaceae bacterium]
MFENFKQNYSGNVAKSVGTYCTNNFAFRPHSSAWDMSGSVNLFNSNCINCDSNSYLLADAPNQKFLGWFGGCGDIVCTG